MENRISEFLKILSIGFLSIFIIINSVLLISRYQYQKGINHLSAKSYDNAIATFTRAQNLIPQILGKTLFLQDLVRIHTNKGKALHEKGLALWKEKGISPTVFTIYKKAGTNFNKAVEIDSNDYITTYWLAKTQNALESLSGYLKPGKPNPYNARPLYEKAIALRPSGISVHYSYIRYLFNKGEKKRIPELAQYMTRIYPPSYYHLKKEPFFNDDLLKNMEQGLLIALDKNITPKLALQALSDIQVKKQNYKKAIYLYHKSMELEPLANTWKNYLYLGQLYLKTPAAKKAGERGKSMPWFLKGLKTANNFDATLARIFRIHTQEKALEEFIRFAILAQENLGYTQSLDINVAKAWIKLEKPQLARARLIKLNAKKPNANAHYLLAKIAEKEKNWNRVELSAQKATTLDRENAGYYQLFSKALIYQRKYIHAEEIATKAITHAPANNPWVYNNRARIRWRLKKYKQACQDWKKAFAIKPDRSDFPFRIALALEQQGLFTQALTYAQKALTLAPNNKKYKTLKKRLQHQ